MLIAVSLTQPNWESICAVVTVTCGVAIQSPVQQRLLGSRSRSASGRSQLFEHVLQLRRKGRLKDKVLTRRRVNEAEPAGVKEMAGLKQGLLTASVQRIANYRIAQPGEMYPDLVRPSGVRVDFE